MTTSTKLVQIGRARNILRTLGLRSAIGYLRARSWSVEAAAWILATRAGRGEK